jgi:predicted Zn-dependent peptidase
VSASRWQQQQDPITGRIVHQTRTRLGLALWVVPTPGFVRSHAALTTRYGSMDTALADGTPIPTGTAHFLEHRMFQTPEGDVFEQYEARGASANAWTSFDHTSYVFDCTSAFEENLGTLLETLAHHHHDAKGIAREKDIVGQEIALYADDAGWRGYVALLEGLYARHPVRLDIAGTRESIEVLDDAFLQRVHHDYYGHRNMLLVVAGDRDPDEVLAQVEQIPGGRPGRRVHRQAVWEPRRVARKRTRLSLDVPRPHVLFGLKDEAAVGPVARVRQRVLSTLALEALFVDGGRLQSRWYDEGLVDDNLHASYELGPDHAYGLISAELDDPASLEARLLPALRREARLGVTTEEVERARRRWIGRHLRSFNAPEEVASWVLGVALEGTRIGAGLDALQRATAKSVSARLRELASSPASWVRIDPR